MRYLRTLLVHSEGLFLHAISRFPWTFGNFLPPDYSVPYSNQHAYRLCFFRQEFYRKVLIFL